MSNSLVQKRVVLVYHLILPHFLSFTKCRNSWKASLQDVLREMLHLKTTIAKFAEGKFRCLQVKSFASNFQLRLAASCLISVINLFKLSWCLAWRVRWVCRLVGWLEEESWLAQAKIQIVSIYMRPERQVVQSFQTMDFSCLLPATLQSPLNIHLAYSGVFSGTCVRFFATLHTLLLYKLRLNFDQGSQPQRVKFIHYSRERNKEMKIHWMRTKLVFHLNADYLYKFEASKFAAKLSDGLGGFSHFHMGRISTNNNNGKYSTTFGISSFMAVDLDLVKRVLSVAGPLSVFCPPRMQNRWDCSKQHYAGISGPGLVIIMVVVSLSSSPLLSLFLSLVLLHTMLRPSPNPYLALKNGLYSTGKIQMFSVFCCQYTQRYQGFLFSYTLLFILIRYVLLLLKVYCSAYDFRLTIFLGSEGGGTSVSVGHCFPTVWHHPTKNSLALGPTHQGSCSFIRFPPYKEWYNLHKPWAALYCLELVTCKLLSHFKPMQT